MLSRPVRLTAALALCVSLAAPAAALASSTQPVRMFESSDCPATPQLAFGSVTIPDGATSQVLRRKKESGSLGCSSRLSQVVRLSAGKKDCVNLYVFLEATRPRGDTASSISLATFLSPMKRDASGQFAGSFADVTGQALRPAHGRWQTGREDLSGYMAQGILRDSVRNRLYTASILWDGSYDECGGEQLARVRAAARKMIRSFVVTLTDATTDPPSDTLSAPAGS